MSTNSADLASLEGRVAALEDTLKRLIDNLADNNDKFIEALFVLARSEKSTDKEDAVKKCKGGICPNDPPSCKSEKKDKDKDDKKGGRP